MSGKTKIPWTNASWSPIIGCTKISPGCTNCYAERMARRQVAIGCARGDTVDDHMQTWIDYSDVIDSDTGKWSGEIVFRYNQIDKPLHWKKPRMIFVCSMSDLFHEKVTDEMICRVFAIIQQCPQHTFQILTKRPERAVDWFNFYWNYYKSDNVWFGATVENQKMADERASLLWKFPLITFVSIEPMLGPIDIEGYANDLDWVIVGCESGPQRRECKIDWVYQIAETCDHYMIPLFIKQISIDGKVSKNMDDWPADLRVRQFLEVKND